MRNLITAILMTIVTTILLGLVYPLVVTGKANGTMPQDTVVRLRVIPGVRDAGGMVGTVFARLDDNGLDGARAALSATVSIVDKMATKGIIHRNTAGRYKSRLSSRLAKASA